eukprot:TRINITY_DN4085_c0_g1_i2.p1 TRINITY_DN4085_c0_g1~~TRINITY_DN4085_c0_g1_i2.p1  ORF type:complete len:253 (+),score=57.44 TRINITY_DN4085_c0_g1_i2:114-872(+)
MCIRDSKMGVYANWDTMKECGGQWGFCYDGSYDFFTQGIRPYHGYCWDKVNVPPQHDKKGRCVCTTGWFGGDCSYPYCVGSKTLTGRKGTLMDHHDVLVTSSTNETVPTATAGYKPSSYCRWYIVPNETVNFIVVRVEYFDLETGYDFLKVFDGNDFSNRTILRDQYHQYSLDGVMTGKGISAATTTKETRQLFRTSGPKFLSTGPNLFLQFRSDVANPQQHKGFKMSYEGCLLYTSPSPRDRTRSRMPSSA